MVVYGLTMAAARFNILFQDCIVSLQIQLELIYSHKNYNGHGLIQRPLTFKAKALLSGHPGNHNYHSLKCIRIN